MARDAALPAIERLLRLARELNMLRPPDHQERIARAVADTQESFRANPEAGLPARGEDALSSIWSGRWQVRATPHRRGFERSCDDLQRLVDQRKGAAD